jgi:hypothetical protein
MSRPKEARRVQAAQRGKQCAPHGGQGVSSHESKVQLVRWLFQSFCTDSSRFDRHPRLLWSHFWEPGLRPKASHSHGRHTRLPAPLRAGKAAFIQCSLALEKWPCASCDSAADSTPHAAMPHPRGSTLRRPPDAQSAGRGAARGAVGVPTRGGGRLQTGAAHPTSNHPNRQLAAVAQGNHDPRGGNA